VYGSQGRGGNVSFSIPQLSDWHLLAAIKQYLGAGRLVPKFSDDGELGVGLVISNKPDLLGRVIPLLAGRSPLEKRLREFNDWAKEQFGLPYH